MNELVQKFKIHLEEDGKSVKTIESYVGNTSAFVVFLEVREWISMETRNMFYFGRPIKASYEIERREKYEIGDNIQLKNKELYVNQYSAHALKDEVIYKYRLCRKNGRRYFKMDFISF